MFAPLMTLCTVDAWPALPQDWWRAWSLAPALLLPWLALAAWSGASASRSGLPAGSARRWRMAGLALLGVALISPLCRLGATLAGAHMAQLMVLVAGCALLAAGWRAPQRLGGAALHGAAVAHGLLLWVWHLPAVYEAALVSGVVHVGMTAALALASFAFWRQVFHAEAPHRGAVLVALLLTLAHTGLLGALLTFAGTPLYAVQAAGARAWGLEPLVDQQVAGLLMWVPGGLGYMGVALGLAVRWAGRAVRRTRATGASF
ncbi:cytochrome c oxidase assembly protein [Xenophilus sp. Marseille-Q4582]|uniref:cytochrome c oxidase assembly protein n=1 Tax=Xenophilus sp. Marseille-Q4582 TaxID=2866600 RepID=UPI001CE49293|nr:cytochrome c oxidase assembly protein [Xenophilus sp. Marseille-Q4582]